MGENINFELKALGIEKLTRFHLKMATPAYDLNMSHIFLPGTEGVGHTAKIWNSNKFEIRNNSKTRILK